MFKLYSLQASEPLTKRIYLDESGHICKGNYPPDIAHFTSSEHPISDIKGFHKALVSVAAAGGCLVKGELHRTLNNERRGGATQSDDVTNWLCLDLDGLTGFENIADFMDKHPELSDVSYIVQYSSSHKLPTSKGIHAHIFMLLSHPYHAQYLKGWLTKQNVDETLYEGKVQKQLTLNRTNSVLHFPIDITACQNDKLLYVAPPIIENNVVYNRPTKFIELVLKKKSTLPIERLQHGSLEAQKTAALKQFNRLRKEQGLDAIRAKTKIMDGIEVMPDCGEFIITGMKEERGFVYFNMNGGDSWSWYHPSSNFKYIHCFKDDRNYLTSRILPKYYASMEAARRKTAQEPTPDGVILLAFRDLRSASYFNGTFDPTTQDLVIHQARSEVQLAHFMQQRGRELGDFIEQWDMEFAPQNPVICNPQHRFLNTYAPSPFYRQALTPAKDLSRCPTIRRVILSAVSSNTWNEVTEHFLNWLAVIFQYRVKTRTAWVLHGIPGTGKGILVNLILTPLLGRRYVQQRRMSELEEKYTGWLEEALIAVIDEVQISSSQRKSLITGDLKNFITEPRCTIRHMNRIAYLAESYTNFLLFSNMDDPVEIVENDRRFNSGDYQHDRLAFNSNDCTLIQDELPFFFDYIMQREANVDRASTIIKNQARHDIIQASRNSIDVLAQALRDGDLTPFVDALPDTKMLIDVAGVNSAVGVQYSKIVLRELTNITNVNIANEDGFYRYETRLSRDELFILFEYGVGGMPHSPHKFTKMLAHKHIVLKRMRIDDKVTMGLTLTWVVSRDWIESHKPDPVAVSTLGRVVPIKARQ